MSSNKLECHMCTVDDRKMIIGLFQEYDIDADLVEACFDGETLMVIVANDNPIVDALIMSSIYVETFTVEYSFKKMLNNCTTDKPIILEGSNKRKCHIVPVDEDIHIVHCNVELVRYSDHFKNAKLWKPTIDCETSNEYWSL